MTLRDPRTVFTATALAILLGAGFCPSDARAEQTAVMSVTQIAAGYADEGHSLAIASDGTVWAWGLNDAGQLGDGTTTNRPTPVRVSRLRDAIAVAAGSGHSLALASDGTVWAWGSDYGSIPQPISALTDVVAIAAGDQESLALKRDGTVWQWPGYNYSNGLRGEPYRVAGLAGVVAIAVGGGGMGFLYDHALAVRSDGSVWIWGHGDTPWARVAPAPVPGLEGTVAVGAGVEHEIAALMSDGMVRTWRYTAGLGQSQLSNAAAIAVGADHILALKVDGTVWGVGINGGSQFIYGAMYGTVPARVVGLADVVRIATSFDHGLALKEDGTLWAWGENGSGQLGDGTTTNRLTPAQVNGLPPLLMAPAVNSVVSAASFRAEPVAPGEIVSIFGRQIGPADGAINVPTAAGVFESTLAQTRVLFDGIAAPLLFAQAGQVNAVAPYALAGKTATEVQVEYRGVKSSPQKLAVAETAPGIFTVDASGAGQAMILNEDGSLNSSSKPAPRGSTVTLFTTGEGQTSPPGVDGRVAATPLPRPVAPVSVQVGGQEADVLEAVSAPGLAGVLQVKVRIPEAVTAGSSVPVMLKVGAVQSQAGVTVAVQ